MQISIVVKECKRCGQRYYGGNKNLELQPLQQLEVLLSKVVSCPHCPQDIGPREPGYRRI